MRHASIVSSSVAPSSERRTSIASWEKDKPRRQAALKVVTAGAEAGAFEVFAIAVGQNLADELARGLNVETDRRLGMIEILRPATPASRMVTRRSARCPTL